jgi:hypothetical protein
MFIFVLGESIFKFFDLGKDEVKDGRLPWVFYNYLWDCLKYYSKPKLDGSDVLSISRMASSKCIYCPYFVDLASST